MRVVVVWLYSLECGTVGKSLGRRRGFWGRGTRWASELIGWGDVGLVEEQVLGLAGGRVVGRAVQLFGEFGCEGRKSTIPLCE